MKKMFLICPVRNISEQDRKDLLLTLKKLESEYEVYYPARDTDQNDNTGYRICTDNKNAIMQADIIGVYWDGKSQGGLFDMGMAFALNKPIKVILTPSKTEGKSFQNMLMEWECDRV